MLQNKRFAYNTILPLLHSLCLIYLLRIRYFGFYVTKRATRLNFKSKLYMAELSLEVNTNCFFNEKMDISARLQSTLHNIVYK